MPKVTFFPLLSSNLQMLFDPENDVIESFIMSSTTKTWIVTIGDDGTFNTVEVLSTYSLDFSQSGNSFYLYLL